MAQVQLATKVSINTYMSLKSYADTNNISMASIVDKAIIEHLTAVGWLEPDKGPEIQKSVNNTFKPITRGPDGKFQKTSK